VDVAVGFAGIGIFLLPLELVAIRLPVFFLQWEHLQLALLFGLGLGEKSRCGASGLCDPVILSNSFAGNLRRDGAGEDRTKHGVRVRETEREKVGKDEVGDDRGDIGGFELVRGENDAVQLWLQRLCYP